MELRQLKYFVKIAELKSYTKAAEFLYVSQPTLSAQILNLERDLNTQLFFRNSRTVKMTLSGQILFEEAKKIFTELELCKTRIEQIESGVSGEIKIGFLEFYESSNTPIFLKAFREKYPGIILTLNQYPVNKLNDQLEQGYVDIIITIIPQNEKLPDNLERFTLNSDKLVLAIPAETDFGRAAVKGYEFLAPFLSRPLFIWSELFETHLDTVLSLTGAASDSLQVIPTEKATCCMMRSITEAGYTILPYKIALSLNNRDFIFVFPPSAKANLEIAFIKKRETSNPSLYHFMSELTQFFSRPL